MALGDTLKNYVIGVGVKDNNFTAGLKNMGGQLKGFVSQMGIMLGAGSLGMALKNFTDMGMSISNFSSMTGIAVEDISTLGAALERFGGDSETAKNSLQSLQQGLSLAEWGQGDLLQTSAMYGVNLFNDDGSIKNAQQLLMGLADDFTHLTKAQAFSLGQKLGLDESTIQLLQQGRNNIDIILNEVSSQGVIDARQATDAKKFALEINKLKRNLATLGRSIATSVMPVLQEFTKILTKIVDFLKQFDAATYAIGAGIVALGWTIKNFGKFITVFSKSFWKANLPLVALTTGLTLLFLIIEDIYGFFNGKESLLGDILKNERVKKVIADIQNAFAWIKDLINNFSFDKLFDGLLSLAKGLKDAFGDALVWVWETLKAIGSNIGAIIINPIINGINNILAKLPKGFTDFFGFENGFQLPRYEMKELPNFFKVIDRRETERQAQAAQNSNINNNNSKSANNVQNNNITVNMAAGSSPYEVEKAAENGMNKALNLSASSFVGYK